MSKTFEEWWDKEQCFHTAKGLAQAAFNAGYEAGKATRKSFSEVHPANPDAKCKCEHWQSCPECHPTAHPAPSQEPSCNPDPRAPHGFCRNTSHSEGRYVCECEFWEPPPEQEPVAWMIECRNGFTGWWDGKSRLDCRLFNKDPNKGKRFVNKDAAELLISTQGNSCMIATEHMWCEMPKPIPNLTVSADWVAPSQEPIEKQLKKARRACEWYKKRCDLLQSNQSKMRDPERTIVCDILANGSLLEPAGNRYAAPSQEPVAWMRKRDGELFSKYAHEHYKSGSIPLYTAPPDAAAQIAELLAANTELNSALMAQDVEHTKQIAELEGQNNRLMKHVSNLATELDKYRNAIGIVADVCESAMKGIEE